MLASFFHQEVDNSYVKISTINNNEPLKLKGLTTLKRMNFIDDKIKRYRVDQ